MSNISKMPQHWRGLQRWCEWQDIRQPKAVCLNQIKWLQRNRQQAFNPLVEGSTPSRPTRFEAAHNNVGRFIFIRFPEVL